MALLDSAKIKHLVLGAPTAVATSKRAANVAVIRVLWYTGECFNHASPLLAEPRVRFQTSGTDQGSRAGEGGVRTHDRATQLEERSERLVRGRPRRLPKLRRHEQLSLATPPPRPACMHACPRQCIRSAVDTLCDVVRWVCGRSYAGDLTTAMIKAAGDSAKALEALRAHLPSILLETVDGNADDARTKHIIDGLPSCFVEGEAAQPVLIRCLDEHITLRESIAAESIAATTDEDPAFKTKRDLEISSLKSAKAKLEQQEAAKRTAVAAAAVGTTPSKERSSSAESPASLDETATPAERKIYRSLKKIGRDVNAGFEGCEERDVRARRSQLAVSGPGEWAACHTHKQASTDSLYTPT